ncbi:hypothetical protein V495_06362 [Pseudogymnoascus sp. VKM F-4514 (FW-929)]|nr:hypothetical protein V495_06362 [Pseudogymnoascus sp. VKM F-4514 (FW-929)]KFY68080.1 hypothetical protein V497_00020 [Pseudogymnoascus sp. VKM F-4516 (FW-969)]
MDSFGFSQAFGRANDLYNLPTTQRNHTLELLFSPSAGAGFTILRNRIGSGGSGDSIEPTSPGSPGATPKYYIKEYASVSININYLGFLNKPDYTTSYSSMFSSGTQAADFIKVLHPALAAAGLGSVGINCCDMRIRIRGYTWANNIYTAIVNGGVSAYFYWEGIEVATNNARLIQISGTTVNPSGRLWAYAQWSRSVRPGAVRVAISGAPSGVKTSTFKNMDGTVSVQVINTNSSSTAVQVTTTDFSATSAQAYVTSQSNIAVTSLSATLSDSIISAAVPGHGMVTIILTGGGSGGGGGSTTVVSPPTTTAPSNGATQTQWGQGAGQGWTVVGEFYDVLGALPYKSSHLLLLPRNKLLFGLTQLPASASRTFIYTGNILNLAILPGFLSQGVRKPTGAHMIWAASAAYKDCRFKFYYGDERKADRTAIYRVNGELHEELYWDLAEEKTHGP